MCRRNSANPISGGETLFGVSEFLPYFQAQALDVGIIDGIWNGMWQSLKMAGAAAAGFEVNVAPHNFYGHLCTMMNAHFAAAVPNLRIMETDIDRLPWDDELVTNIACLRRRSSSSSAKNLAGAPILSKKRLFAHPPKGGTTRGVVIRVMRGLLATDLHGKILCELASTNRPDRSTGTCPHSVVKHCVGNLSVHTVPTG